MMKSQLMKLDIHTKFERILKLFISLQVRTSNITVHEKIVIK